MPKAANRPISTVEAARVIFRTGTPSQPQIQRVYKQMKCGALQVHSYGGNPLHWTTTERALADYLASRMIKRRGEPPSRGRAPKAIATRAPSSTAHMQQARRLRSMYRGMWRDYFLAVMLRRRTAHRSVAFHRAVMAGQVLLLAAIVSCLVAAVRFTHVPTRPERLAIERWIDANTDRYQVTCWHPTQPAPDGNGLLVEVEYRYAKDSPRTIHTDRTFRVVGNTVEEYSLE